MIWVTRGGVNGLGKLYLLSHIKCIRNIFLVETFLWWPIRYLFVGRCTSGERGCCDKLRVGKKNVQHIYFLFYLNNFSNSFELVAVTFLCANSWIWHKVYFDCNKTKVMILSPADLKLNTIFKQSKLSRSQQHTKCSYNLRAWYILLEETNNVQSIVWNWCRWRYREKNG